MTLDIINTLSPLFQRYITLKRVSTAATYNYAARNMHGWPVFDSTMHCPKCSGGSWTYVAVKGGANLLQLNDDERLYVGSQTLDRMFRGDGMDGKNHHGSERTKRATQPPPKIGEPHTPVNMPCSPHKPSSPSLVFPCSLASHPGLTTFL